MKRYFAYIRVSTVKQGERGSSLQEQRAAIEAFALRNRLQIVAWFEERETAAKQGRRMFSQMLSQLADGEANGVIIHKIDRSARNLRDWANLGDLIDSGTDVQFVHDNVDLQSRGGRLSADIQAVVAADYVRNLRDEVKKGFYGRLKQGFYPLPAPIGYLDRGKARAKEIDPLKGPLVRQAFELYANARMSLTQLQVELTARGLRSRRGNIITPFSLSEILKNPFYTGIIRIDRTNEHFPGVHAPLVPKPLFDQVQDVLAGKAQSRVQTHDFIFRRFIRCSGCKYHLVGEIKKGRYIYYRCFNRDCRGSVLRETDVLDEFWSVLNLVRLSPAEIGDIRDMAASITSDQKAEGEARRQSIEMRLGAVEARLARLADALVDGLLPKDAYEARRADLLGERAELVEEMQNPANHETTATTLFRYLELKNIKEFAFKFATEAEKREIVRDVTWNCEAERKKPAITLKSPYQEIVNWRKNSSGGPYRSTLGTRTRQLLDILMAVAKQANDPLLASNDNSPLWQLRKRA